MVVNVNRERCDVYVGRNRSMGGALLGRGGWGNPFVVGRDGTREEVIERYRAQLKAMVRDGRVTQQQLAALHGKRLGCHCAPRACHADVLERAARWAAQAQ